MKHTFKKKRRKKVEIAILVNEGNLSCDCYMNVFILPSSKSLKTTCSNWLAEHDRDEKLFMSVDSTVSMISTIAVQLSGLWTDLYIYIYIYTLSFDFFFVTSTYWIFKKWSRQSQRNQEYYSKWLLSWAYTCLWGFSVKNVCGVVRQLCDGLIGELLKSRGPLISKVLYKRLYQATVDARVRCRHLCPL